MGAILAGLLAASSTLFAPATLILDAGHGGDDPGAMVQKLREKNICLTVALKLRKALKKHTVALDVVMTRKADATLSLDQRVAAGSDIPRSVFLSLHVNDSNHRKDHGLVVYAYGTAMPAPKKRHNPVPPLGPPPDELARESAKLALAIVESLRAQKFAVEGVVHSDYYVLRNPYHPSVLVELGYLSNPKDRDRLARADYQQKLADALAKAVRGYLKIKVGPGTDTVPRKRKS